jgi:hypothetical protein
MFVPDNLRSYTRNGNPNVREFGDEILDWYNDKGGILHNETPSEGLKFKAIRIPLIGCELTGKDLLLMSIIYRILLFAVLLVYVFI